MGFLRMLEQLNVFCLPTLRAFDYVELHRLTLFQSSKPLRLDGGMMNEDILTILPADEPETL